MKTCKITYVYIRVTICYPTFFSTSEKTCLWHLIFANSNTGDPLHNLTDLHTTEQHTTELHTTQRLGGVLARLCAICSDSNTGWPIVGPKSVLSSRRWANVSPAYIAIRLVRLWRGLPIRVTYTTEPAHHRAVGLHAARWCVALWCVIRLGCVEGHPWTG